MASSVTVTRAWSIDENTTFENALVQHLEMPEDQKWNEIAKGLPGKSALELRMHFDRLLRDIDYIENGQVPLPEVPVSNCNSPGFSPRFADGGWDSGGSADGTAFTGSPGSRRASTVCGTKQQQQQQQSTPYPQAVQQGQGHGMPPTQPKTEQERKKGVPWTEEEHK